MEWITLLKCPISGQSLKKLSESDLENLNGDIMHGKIFGAGGIEIKEALTQAFATPDSKFFYPYVNGIAFLMTSLALSRGTEMNSEGADEDKLLVRDFYDQKGWFTNEKGDYEDAVIYEDLREVAKDYVKKCHDRVSRFLPSEGRYMLDAASGAIQYADYLQYSAGFDFRVCVDFSFQALQEARKKLGDKGIYILADMTNMPFQDNVMDGFISLNTIYHIPKDQQAKAIGELYRLLKPGGSGVVVYDWFKHSLWMNGALLPFRAAVYIKNRTLGMLGKMTGKGAPSKRLYFYAHTLSYFRRNLPEFQLKVWRSLSVPFMRYYIHRGFLGEKFLHKVYEAEEKNPEKCGKNGEYPMFVFKKPVTS